MSDQSIHHETLAGDPFAATPCACNDGWVTIGQIVVDPETGEEIEEYALSLCRRCGEAMAACTRRVTCAELGK
jgi:hypothetical protein